MIREVTMYQCVCDRCGKICIDEFNGYVGWTDKHGAVEMACESDWVNIDGKDYCPDCYEIDKETDDYVPKKNS